MDHEGVTAQGAGTGITAEWVWDYFRDVDSMDPQRVTQYYGPDGTFRFANQAPARGPEAIGAMLTQFYQMLRGMRHRNTGLWLGDRSAVFEAEVHFTRADGHEVVVPAVSILRVRDGKVADFRMVMDAAPVMGES